VPTSRVDCVPFPTRVLKSLSTRREVADRHLTPGSSTMFSGLLLSLSLLSSFAHCAPVQDGGSESTPPTPAKQLAPSEDAFYNTRPNIASFKAGAVLDSRPVPNPITFDNKSPIKPKAAWQIKYRTQNSVGAPEEAMMTILEPYNAVKDNLFMYHWFSVSIYLVFRRSKADNMLSGRGFQCVRLIYAPI
jgi:hypothetical protein